MIGIDAGVAIAVAVSDGRAFHMPDETDIDNQIKTLQQSRARCSHGSHQWNRRSDQLRRLYERRSHLRDETDRHIAKTIATTPNIRAVGAEITNNKGMVASAAGTAEHPGTSVAAKRTLNRLLHSSRFAGVRVAIERACAKVAKLYVPVPAPGTSSMCHRCGGKGIRESQAVFRCPGCGWVGNADFNAAHNVDHRTCTHLSIDWVQKNPAAGAVVVRRSDGRNPSRAPCDASEAISKNTSPTLGTIVYRPHTQPIPERQSMNVPLVLSQRHNATPEVLLRRFGRRYQLPAGVSQARHPERRQEAGLL